MRRFVFICGTLVSFNMLNAQLALSPQSLTFGSQAIGISSVVQTVTLKNNFGKGGGGGSAPTTTGGNISITSVAINGTNSADFSENDSCTGVSLALGTSCFVNVTFTPTAAGSRTASIIINGSSTATVGLSGTGTGPAVTFSSTSLSFGNQPINTPTGAIGAMLTNTGNANLTVTSVTATGTDSADYFVATDSCVGTLAPGASCGFGVEFRPLAAGVRSASISVYDNAAGSPQNLSVTGNGTAPAVTLSTASISFGNEGISTAAPTQTVTVTNGGTASLSISSVTITGSGSGDFSETNSCSTIATGSSCAIVVGFTPASASAFTATLSISDNAGGSPQTVALTGTGTIVGPAVQAAVSSASFNPGESMTPGSMVSIFGVNLAPGRAQSSTLPLPTNLGGVQVKFGSTPAPLLYVSSGLINAIVPWGIPDDTAQVTVTTGGASSAPAAIAIGPSNPGIFVSGGNALALIVAPDGTYQGVMSATNAAAPGDILELYATGLGAVTNPPVVGAAAGGDSLVGLPVAANIGGVPANVLGAALAPDFAGLYQVNIVVPQTFCATCGSTTGGTVSPAGAVVQVPVQLFAGSGASNVATLDLVNPAAPPGLSIASLTTASGAPGSVLGISGSFTADTVTSVQFAMAGQTMDVTPVSLDTGSIRVLVPPFWNAGPNAFSAATGTVQVIQTVGGQQQASNTSVFSIQNLPQVTGTPGQFTASVLLIIEETVQQLAAALSFSQNAGVTLATDATQASLESFVTSTETFRQAILAASANPSAATTLAVVDGQPVLGNAAFLSNTDQLLAAPYVESTSGALTGSARRAGKSLEPRTQGAPTCEPTAVAQVNDLASGRGDSPAVPYANQWENCVGTGFYDVITNSTDTVDMLDWVDGLTQTPGPQPQGAGAPPLLAALTTLPLSAGTTGQLASGVQVTNSPPNQGPGIIAQALQKMENLWASWGVDQTLSSAVGRIKAGSGALSDWASALVKAWPELQSIPTRLLAPWVSMTAGQPNLATPAPVQTIFVKGTAYGPNGPLPNAQVTVSTNPPNVQASTATFNDGSYVLCISTGGIGTIYPSSGTISIQSTTYAGQQPLNLTLGTQNINVTLQAATCTFAQQTAWNTQCGIINQNALVS